MTNGWSYIFRILKGESPKDVMASMPKEDYEKVSSAINSLKETNIPRQQRRAIERKFRTIKR